jgi:hypothetical protein
VLLIKSKSKEEESLPLLVLSYLMTRGVQSSFLGSWDSVLINVPMDAPKGGSAVEMDVDNTASIL